VVKFLFTNSKVETKVAVLACWTLLWFVAEAWRFNRTTSLLHHHRCRSRGGAWA